MSQAFSCVGHWLVPDPTEFVELGLLLWRLQPWAWSCRGSRLRLVPWNLLTWPTPEEFAHSGLLLQMSLTGACSQRGCGPVSYLTEFSLSALLLQRSLIWAHLLFFNKRPVQILLSAVSHYYLITSVVEDVYLFVETDFETASFIHLGEEFNGTDVLMTLESRTNCNNIYVRG